MSIDGRASKNDSEQQQAGKALAGEIPNNVPEVPERPHTSQIAVTHQRKREHEEPAQAETD
jgi:hypothetical protein